MENSLLVIARQFAEQYSASIKKDQFFLIDKSIVEKLIRFANIDRNDRVLEVGPGLGFLTKALAQTAKEVISNNSCFLAAKPKIFGKRYLLER